MSNASNPELVPTITDSFLNWFQNDILPYFVATFDIITIIVGLILNIILIVTFKKRGLFKETSSHFVFMLCISDFIAYICMLLPTVITSFTKNWILSTPVCFIHGCMIALMLYVSFLFLIILAVERTVKLANQELYEKTFESRKLVNILTILIWLLSSAVAFVAISGIAEIRYDFYHQGCMLDYMTSYLLLNVHFVTTLGVSFLVMLVCYSIIFDARRRALKASRTQSLRQTGSAGKMRKTAFTDNYNVKSGMKTGENSARGLLSITETEEPSDSVETSEKIPCESNIKDGKASKQNKPRVKSAPRQSLLFEVFSDDEENPAFHLAITYLLLWFVLVACYLPYYIVWYYDSYKPYGLWGGFYTLTMLIINTSFAMKPVIYLGHNRHYRAVTKETIPVSVRERANSVRTSISNAVDKVDDFVFRSVSNRRFAATVAAQKAVLVWKKKLQSIRKKTINLKKNSDDKDKIIGVSITNASTDTKADKIAVAATCQDTHTVEEKRTHELKPVKLRSEPVTPSTIEVTSSSFIERERQKLITNAFSPPPAVYNEPTVAPRDVHHSPERGF